jgi:hypothetical protein
MVVKLSYAIIIFELAVRQAGRQAGSAGTHDEIGLLRQHHDIAGRGLHGARQRLPQTWSIREESQRSKGSG